MEKLFRREVIEAIGHGVIFSDAEQLITYANGSFCELTGYDRSEIVGRNCRFLQGPDTDPETRVRIRKALAAGQPFEGEILNYRKDGKPFWNSLSITPQRSKFGRLIGFVGITRDITERKVQRQRNIQLEEQFRMIFENIGAGVVVHAPDGRTERVNPEARRLLGLSSSAEATAENIRNLGYLREDGEPMPIEELPARRVAATRRPVRRMTVGLKPADIPSIRWLNCNAFPIFGFGGEITAIVVTFTDITHQRHYKVEAQRGRERFELASRATNSLVFDMNLITGEFWGNENFLAVFGSEPPSRLTLVESFEFVIEEDREDYSAALMRAIERREERVAREFRYLRPSGGVGVAQTEFMIHYDAAGEPFRIVGSTRDLTELRRKEERLAASEERLRIVAELSSDMLWELDPRTDLLWRAGDGVERLGLDPSLAPYSGGIWHDFIIPEDRQRVVASFCDALEGTVDRWQEEYRIERADGSALLVEDRAAIIRASDGRASRVVGAVRDITESRRLEDYIRENQSLEALGKLTGGVAHDFNNMLMIIMGNTEMLLEEEPRADVRELLELIQNAARNGAELTSRLLSFARQQPLAPQCLDIRNRITQAAKLIRHALAENITLELDIADTPLNAEVDPSQFDNALVNLAVNARDAMPDGGKVSLEARATSVEAGRLDGILDPGEYVVISLADTGTGMEPEVASRVFEPFFTTKPIGDGTGLGLSMVFGFAKQSGGHVFIDSTPGEGTRIDIYLPQSRQSVPASEGTEPAETALPASDRARVLMLENDEHIRRYVERILETEGYAAIVAKDAKAALARLEHDPGITLLFTEVSLAGDMNGLDLAQAARERFPALKVLVTSGSANEPMLREKIEQREFAWLPKPFSRRELGECLAEILQE